MLLSLYSKYISNLLSAFSSRNYRLYTIGLLVSNLGFLMETIALSWLIYRLTNSGFYVGILFFIGQITVFLSSPFAGVLSDRFPPYKILMITTTIGAIISMTLGISVLMKFESIWFVFVTQLIVGFARGIDSPVRTSYVKELIDKPEHLVNAISLNSSMFNVAKILGPTLAGILIPLVGEWICFVINSLFYMVLIGSLKSMQHKHRKKIDRTTSVFRDIYDGFSYAINYSPIRTILVYIALIGLLGFSINVVLPVYVKQVLGGGADTLGFITTYSGFGAFVAALFMASKKNALGLDLVIFGASLLYSFSFILLGFSDNFNSAAMIMMLSGFAQVLIFASANSILQTLADDGKSGRIIGLYFMFFTAASTLGSLISGTMTDAIGPARTIVAMGSSCIIVTLIYGLQIKKVRKKSFRKYISIGIHPVSLRNEFPLTHKLSKKQKHVRV